MGGSKGCSLGLLEEKNFARLTATNRLGMNFERLPLAGVVFQVYVTLVPGTGGS